MPHLVEIAAPSRLHFGMFSFGQSGVRQFGGMGAMIDAPGLRLRVERAKRFSIDAPAGFRERIEECTRRFGRYFGLAWPPPCAIELISAPRQHIGLGSGTQLGLSVAAGLAEVLDIDVIRSKELQPVRSEELQLLGGSRGTAVPYCQRVKSEDPSRRAVELARSVGRGKRSAIGLYGFMHGGLLIESGKMTEDAVSPLLARSALPEAWRFVLVCPKSDAGLSGDEERRAFEQLPPVASAVTDQLCREAILNLLPAAIESRFDDFGESLFRFGHLAGLCFATQQAGAFATERTARLVEKLRAQGIRGTGQTSWGPTLFALAPNAEAAQSLAGWLEQQPECADCECLIATACNRGATVTRRTA